MSNVLVTGANGFVGQHLCKHLLAQGHAVTAAVRRQGTAPPGTHEVVVGDLGPETDWLEATRGQDVVVHLAARVHVMAEKDSDPLRAFVETNTVGTRRLAQQSAEGGVRRFIYVSSIKAQGEASPVPYSATDTPQPVDPYGISKFRAEQELRALEQRSGLNVMVLRPPLIYGEGVGGNLLRLMKAIAKGVPLPLGSVCNRRAMIAVENFVHIIALCVVTTRHLPVALLVTDGEALSTAEVVHELAIGLGRRPRLVRFSPRLLMLFGTLLRKRAELDRLVGDMQIVSNITDLDPQYEERVAAREALRLTASVFASRPADHPG